jgi:hypothetical protein
MKRKKDRELKIRKISTSSLPEEERRKALFEVFDILFSEMPGKETREKCKRQNY